MSFIQQCNIIQNSSIALKSSVAVVFTFHNLNWYIPILPTNCCHIMFATALIISHICCGNFQRFPMDFQSSTNCADQSLNSLLTLAAKSSMTTLFHPAAIKLADFLFQVTLFMLLLQLFHLPGMTSHSFLIIKSQHFLNNHIKIFLCTLTFLLS